jgi:hypothetical protein
LDVNLIVHVKDIPGKLKADKLPIVLLRAGHIHPTAGCGS